MGKSNRALVRLPRIKRGTTLVHLGVLIMDDLRFDHFTRSLARLSRRSLVKSATGAALGGVAAAIGIGQAHAAGKRAPGNPCRVNSDCLSDMCQAQSGRGRKICVTVCAGSACRVNESCSSGSCRSDVCQPVSTGGSCDCRSDCTSSICRKGICQEPSLGASCSSDHDCIDSRCVNGHCR